MNSGAAKRFLKKKSLWISLYSVYLAFILLSVYSFIAVEYAENIRSNMDDQYTYHLTFTHEGVASHYNVSLHNSNLPGKITLTYYTNANKLDIANIDNIKTIEIDLQSLFEDEAEKVFNKAPSIITEVDLEDLLKGTDGTLTIEIDIDENEPVESVSFKNFPKPLSVLINNQEWDLTGTNYSITGNEFTITDITSGYTEVLIDFEEVNQMPVASFTMNPSSYAGVNESITFDGSASFDPDGEIKIWLWDFGDGYKETGEIVTHSYSSPGEYTIRLIVRNMDVPFSEAYIELGIRIAYGAEDDFDNDYLRDIWEWENFGNLDQNSDSDFDGDGYLNILEQIAGTDPANESSFNNDFDGDTLPDLWEWNYFETLDYGPEDDPDSDGAKTKEEYVAETDPNDDKSTPPAKKEDKKSEQPIGLLLMAVSSVIVVIVFVIIFMWLQKKVKVCKKEKEDKENSETEERL